MLYYEHTTNFNNAIIILLRRIITITNSLRLIVKQYSMLIVILRTLSNKQTIYIIVLKLNIQLTKFMNT